MAASAQNLSTEARDWTAVGIGLNVVLVPLLREYVDKLLGNLYTDLEHDFKIGNEHGNRLSNDQAYQKFGFYYNNQGRRHAIRSHHELGKLYLEGFMRIDRTTTIESFDSSAILNILERAKRNGSNLAYNGVPHLARQIRNNLRNEWAHCDLTKWNHDKFLECFDLMIKTVECLENDPTLDNTYKTKAREAKINLITAVFVKYFML